MKKHLLLAGFFFMSYGIASAQTKLIEKVEKKGNEIVIPYEKYQLSNGLTLVIHEDHSDPIVHLDVTYHVGSAREEIGRSGFAHFFEHMMFQGSDHVADEQHFKTVSEAGGTLNGSTTGDRTNYFETLPSNQLEVAMWLESDRMGFLLDAVTQQKFEVQRATVKNERGQNYDNRPYGRVNEKISEALYPAGHPYSWSTIGTLSDLDKADVNDLKKFFLRWYGPNNATVTVAGDVKAADVVKLAEKYFGPINRGPEVKMPLKPAVTLDKDRYISYEDNIRFPLIAMSFPTVPNRHPDEAPLDVLADIIGGGKNSIMYKNFTKTQTAVNATANHPSAELAGSFQMTVLPYPGKLPADMEKMMREALVEFEKRGVTDDDLLRYKASYEANTINSLASVSGKAAQLAAYQTYTGNPNYIRQDMDRYMKVTKEDVMRVYEKYIKNKPAVILSVYPKGKPELVAHADNFTVVKPARPADLGKETDALVYNKTKDTFDRSKKPASGANPVVKVPAFWENKFPNGLKVIGMKNDELPTVTMQLSIEAGHMMEANDKSKAGIASLVAGMMDEATEKHTAEQLSDELDKLGSSVDVGSDKNYITVTVTTLLKNLDKTLAIAEEKLLHPRFAAEDFDRLKNEQLQGIANQVTQPVVIANNAYNKLLYGADNIMSIPNAGTTETVKSITLEDVKNYYKTNLSPSIANLVIVGDITKETVEPKLAFLKNWTAKAVKMPVAAVAPKIEKTKIYLIDKEKAPQSEIRIGYVALPYDATGEYYKANLMNYVLGGAFNSHINLNLREDKGWTYGARSGFQGDKLAGAFTASAGVKGVATDSSVVEFIKEMKNYGEKGISDDELSFTKSSIGQSDALKYETGVQKASFLKRIITYNLDRGFVDKQNEILKNITKADIDAIAKKDLDLSKMVIVVVGDAKTTKEGLSKLGYEVVELDKEGNKKTID